MIEKINTVPEVPEDLRFVWERDLSAIAEEFKKSYAQGEAETSFQKDLKTRAESLKEFKKEILPAFYGIETKSIQKAYSILENRARAAGVDLEYAGMQDFSEDDLHGNEFEDPEHKKHAETARSNGRTLLLEADLAAAGGSEARMYDLMHLAFGHMVQWSTEDKNMLLTREEAWSIGYRNHEKSQDRVLDMMALYEFEAGMMGLEAVRRALDASDLPAEQKEKITQYFTDYVCADRDFIIQHYRGNHIAFEKYWKFGQPIPPRQELPKVAEFIKRHEVEVGLIRDKQKKD